MIIQRHLQSEKKSLLQKFHDNGMEFKPIYKKHNMARDNDDLLKPIQRPKYIEDINGQQNQSLKERTERNLWRNEEVMEMLYTMQQVKALEKLNDKTIKSENVFKDVEEIMHKNGFIKKSHVQIWTKWKFLKSTYMTSRRNGVMPRIIVPEVYEMIHQMITNHNQNLADSCSSLDGDNSSVSGMVISGVEGGLNNENEKDDSFGMAHPIFGFRLGMVKPEPEDTGYEPNADNGSDNDSLQEQLSAAKTNNEFKEGRKGVEAKANVEAQTIQKVLEIPHRGRGRPPKNPPASVTTQNNTPPTAAMPPLRVAPFAKVNNYANNNAANRPPPPLTIPPSTSRIRVTNFSNLKDSNSVKFTQPKLLPKPAQRQHSPPPAQTARATKETMGQARSSSSPSPSYPKMKQIPMRQTPYSLRPGRAIPDLEASLSPPPSPAVDRLASKKFEEVPTTKHLIMQSSSRNQMPNATYRKRRNDWQDPPVNKMPKYSNFQEEKSENTSEYDKNYGKVLQNVVIDLSSSLRKMQTDMMRDFFNKQSELLEKEHKFQMQQDSMIMKTFQKQTQEILHCVKQLVGGIKGHENCTQNAQLEVPREPNQSKTSRMHQREGRPDENEIDAGEETETVDEEEEEQGESQQEETEMEQDTQDMYTDDEQQQNQSTQQHANIEDEDNEEQLGEDHHSQLNENQIENGLPANRNRNPKQLNED